MRAALGDLVALPQQRATWAILGAGAAAALAGRQADHTFNSRLVGGPDGDRLWTAGKWVGAAYTQVGVGMSVYLLGRFVIPPGDGESRRDKFSHVGFDLIRAQFVAQAMVQGMKPLIGRARPTGECCAFPSGHSATAFAAAAVLERHFGYRFAWPAVAAATYAATSRLHDNRHYLSDVLFGSAVGMAAAWTVVGRHGRAEFGIVPVRGGIAVAITPAQSSKVEAQN